MPFILMSAILQASLGAPSSRIAHPPMLLNQREIFRPDDYPPKAMISGQSGIASSLLHVSSSGMVTPCVITDTTGSVSLDKKTCQLLESRSRFEPATNEEGKTIDGEYRIAATWVLAGKPFNPIFYDFIIPVLTLPVGYKGPLTAILVSDRFGNLASCSVKEVSVDSLAESQICALVTKQIALPSAKSASPEIPAAAVRYASITLRPKTSGL